MILCSYPKSGSTWVRAFIANLLAEDLFETTPVKLNDIKKYVGVNTEIKKRHTLEEQPDIYLVRNPEAIVKSIARHFKVSLDTAAYWALNGFGLLESEDKVGGKILPWLEHVQIGRRWAKLVLYYEDLFDDYPFYSVAAMIGNFSKERIERAIELSRFDKLREQERIEGFDEAPEGVKFFGEG